MRESKIGMWLRGAQLLLGIVLLLAHAGAMAAGEYRIGPGDVIKINVFGHPDLASEVRVGQQGDITFPLIGEVKVGELSTADAERLIATRLESGGFLRQPQVNILVMQFESQKVSVMGQINKPGQYPLDRASHVLDLLAEAGGVNYATAGERAVLLRNDGKKYDISLHQLFEGDPGQNALLRAGDTIYVPKAPQFYIYGEVQHPGVYRLERNMTVSQAITAGGGLTVRGTERRPVVKRRDADGKEKEVVVKGSDLVQDDDVLYIRESWF
jgi:polysaccharide export outer membrane protein